MRYVKKFFLDFDEEEKFIQEMSNKGLQLISIKGFKYEFEEDNQEYNYFIEVLKYKDVYSDEFEKYLCSKEEEHIQFVFATNKACYFRRLKIYGDIFKDEDETLFKKEIYQKNLYAFMGVIFVNLLVLIYSGFSYFNTYKIIYAIIFILNFICAFIFLHLSIKTIKSILNLIE